MAIVRHYCKQRPDLNPICTVRAGHRRITGFYILPGLTSTLETTLTLPIPSITGQRFLDYLSTTHSELELN